MPEKCVSIEISPLFKPLKEEKVGAPVRRLTYGWDITPSKSSWEEEPEDPTTYWERRFQEARAKDNWPVGVKRWDE